MFEWIVILGTLGAFLWKQKPDPRRVRQFALAYLLPAVLLSLALVYFMTGTVDVSRAPIAVQIALFAAAFLAGMTFRHVAIAPVPANRWVSGIVGIGGCAIAAFLALS